MTEALRREEFVINHKMVYRLRCKLGIQSTIHTYQERLQELTIWGSHSRKGNCLDNACVDFFLTP